MHGTRETYLHVLMVWMLSPISVKPVQMTLGNARNNEIIPDRLVIAPNPYGYARGDPADSLGKDTTVNKIRGEFLFKMR